MTGLCAPQDEDSEAVLAADFEIGHFIRERIVPRAVLYFTGEAIEDDDDDVSDESRRGLAGRMLVASLLLASLNKNLSFTCTAFLLLKDILMREFAGDTEIILFFQKQKKSQPTFEC